MERLGFGLVGGVFLTQNVTNHLSM